MSEAKYRQLIDSKLKRYECRECNVILRAREYLSHQREVHKVPKKTCPWCRQVEFVRMDYEHLNSCARGRVYVKPKAEALPNLDKNELELALKMESEIVPVANNYKLNDREYDEWSRKRGGITRDIGEHVKQPHARLYETLDTEVPDWVSHLPSQEELAQQFKLRFKVKRSMVNHFHENLTNTFEFSADSNLEAKWPKLYWFNPFLYFYHVSMRFDAWNSFIKVYEANRDTLFVVPNYWTLCSGGGEHHRHMIMISKTSDFRTIWNKVQGPGGGRKKFARPMNPVTQPLKLSNTIAYLSSPASTCLDESISSVNDLNGDNEFTGHSTWTPKRKKGTCHYFINKPTPPETVLFLAPLYGEGWTKPYMEWYYRNTSGVGVKSLVKNGSWEAQVIDLARKKFLLMAIECHQKFVPFIEGSASFIHLRSKMSLVRDDAISEYSEPEWNRFQLENHNGLLYCVGHEMYRLGKVQQQILNVLETEISRERQRHDEEKQQLRQQMQQQQESLQRQYDEEKRELKQQHESFQRQYDEERRELKQQRESLQRQYNELFIETTRYREIVFEEYKNKRPRTQ